MSKKTNDELTALTAEQHKAARAHAIHSVHELAQSYLEIRAKRDEYEAGMNDVSVQIQTLILTHELQAAELDFPDVKTSMVVGTSRTLDPTLLLNAGVDPEMLAKGYKVRPTQYIRVAAKKGTEGA